MNEYFVISIILSIQMGIMVWVMLTVRNMEKRINKLGLVHIQFGSDLEGTKSYDEYMKED